MKKYTSEYVSRECLCKKNKYEKLGVKFYNSKKIDIRVNNTIQVKNDPDTYKNLFNKETVGFVEYISDVEYSDKQPSDYDSSIIEEKIIITGYKIYINILNGSTWLVDVYHKIQEDNDEHDGDNITDESDDGYILFGKVDKEKVNNDQLIDDAIFMAKSKGFSLLKTRMERYELAKALFSGKEGMSTYYFFHLMNLSLMYFSKGILPIRAKKLREEGTSIKNIAKILSVSKERVVKVLSSEPIEFIQERLKGIEI